MDFKNEEWSISLGQLTAMSTTMGLTGCGAGMSDSQVNSIDNGDASKLPIPLKPTQKDMMASRFLGHAAWGGNTAEIQRVLNVGLENWLAQQMSQPIQQSFVQWLIDRGYGQKGNSSTQGLYPGLWCRLMTSPDLVRQRIALALSEFFVCSVDKLITGGYSLGLQSLWCDFFSKRK